MMGPHTFDSETINKNVAKASAGNYVLGRQDSGTGESEVDFVERSDSDVNAKLLSWIGETTAPQFMFSYVSSRRVAFEKECRLYHALSPPANRDHPHKPHKVDWTCPVCEAFGGTSRLPRQFRASIP